MAARTTINNSGWPADGTVATGGVGGNTGLEAVAGFTVRTLDATNLPPPAAAASVTKVLRSTAGNSASFKIDATGAGTSGSKYTVQFWMRAVRTDPTLASAPADGTVVDMFTSKSGGGLDFRCCRMYLVKPSTSPTYLSGLCLHTRRVSGAGTGTPDHPAGVDGSYGTNTRVNFPWERWVRVGVAITPNASTGSTHLYLNGQTASRVSAMNTTTVSNATLDDMTVTFPAWAGIYFEVVMFLSYDGTGNPELTQSPSAANSSFTTPTDHQVAFHWSARYSDVVSGGATATTEGSNWQHITGASGPPTVTDYATGGTNNWASRMTWSGTATTSTMRSTRDLGTLPYNSEGWVAICLHDSLNTVNTNTQKQLVLWDAANSSIPFTFVWTPASIFYGSSSAANNIGSLPGINHRIGLAILLNSDGRAALAWHRMTDAAAGTAVYDVRQMYHVCTLPDWTPAALGKVQLYHGAGASAEVNEMGGISVHRNITYVGPDSTTQALISSLTPELTSPDNHYPLTYASLRDAEAAACPAFYYIKGVTPAVCIYQTAGWSGKTPLAFCNRNGRAFKSAPGHWLQFTNPLTNHAASASSNALAVSIGTAVAEKVAAMSVAAAEAESYVHLGAAVPGSGGNWTAYGSVLCDTYNAVLLDRIRRHETHDRIFFSPLPGGYAYSDGNHPTEQGAVDHNIDFVTRRTLVRSYAKSGRPLPPSIRKV